MSQKSEDEIAAEKKFLRAAVTPVRNRRRSRSRSPTSSLAPPTPTPSKRQMEPLEEEDEEKDTSGMMSWQQFHANPFSKATNFQIPLESANP